MGAYPRPSKNRGVRVIALACVLALSSCSTAKPNGAGKHSGGSSSKRYNVAFVTASIGLVGYQVMHCAAKQDAKKYNLGLTWQGSNSTSVSEEMNVLQSVEARHPDGLILIPWDSSAFVAPVKKLMDAGTPVVTTDGSLTKPVDAVNVRTNNVDAGRAAAVDLGAKLHGKGSVAILTDSPANVVQNQRWQGFRSTLAAKYPNIKVLAPQYVGADLSKATSIASSLLTSNRNLGAFYSTQDVGSNGAASALRAAGKSGKVINIGWDATKQTVQLLKSGALDGIVSQNFVQEGHLMMQAINTALRKPNSKPKHDVFPSSKYLTRANVDAASSRDYIYIPQC